MTTLNVPSSPKDKKDFLVKLSKQAKKVIATTGKFKNINAVLIEFYKRKTGAKALASYKKWMSRGFKVKKGSKGFPIWSKPITSTKQKEDGEDEVVTFYSLCHLFSDDQVEKIDADRKKVG